MTNKHVTRHTVHSGLTITNKHVTRHTVHSGLTIINKHVTRHTVHSGLTITNKHATRHTVHSGLTITNKHVTRQTSSQSLHHRAHQFIPTLSHIPTCSHDCPSKYKHQLHDHNTILSCSHLPVETYKNTGIYLSICPENHLFTQVLIYT